MIKMASLSSTWFCQDRGLKGKRDFSFLQSKKSFLGSFPSGIVQVRLGFSTLQKGPLLPSIKCEKKDEDVKHVSVERPPYYSYMDSTSGQMEPASGARASIPEEAYWPEGTADRVRAARAPPPTGISVGSPSYGQRPGSRRKKYRSSTNAAGSSEASEEVNDADAPEIAEDTSEEEKNEYVGYQTESEYELDKNLGRPSEQEKNEYVVYQTEPEEVTESEYEIDKKLGRPHPFIDPKVKKPIEGTLTNEELWWNWRKPQKEQWSRWQRRKPDVETVFLKAMAETGQVKLYGEHPTLTETSLYRARKHLFKEERLRAEQERLEKIGPIAYYSEWVKAWKRDTSREAIQKHFEETGEDENAQLLEMFCHQTDQEYRIMMGTDVRIKRDPLAMRMREDLIKQIWGGDPVYPTINYIQDPNEVVDYRGPNFHEPTPNMLAYLKEHGKIISREELEKILAKEKTEQVEMTDVDEAMAQAVDIGENDDEEEESEVEGEGEEEVGEEEEDEGEDEESEEEEEEKITRNWSVLKTSPHLRKSKSKGKPKKNGHMSLEDAIEDSENLTDFLMDFEKEE